MEIKTTIDKSKLQMVRTQKPNWSDEGKELPVYRVKLSDLHYNEDNGRIATWISTYYSDKNFPDLHSLSREEFNNVIESFILKANSSDSFKNLVNDIKKKTQINPGVILDDGTIVSGNRRFTALRTLYNEDCDDKYAYFECFILPYPVNKDQKEFVKLIETKTQFGVVSEEDYNPIDRLVTIYLYLINPETKIWSLKEYSKKIGIKPSDAENLYDRAMIMIDFLDFIGNPNAFHIAREKKLDGPIADLAGMYKKMKNSQMAEWRRISPLFYSEMNKGSGDKTRVVRGLKKIYQTDKSKFDELLDSLYKRQTEVEKGLFENTIIHTDVKTDKNGTVVPLVSVESTEIESARRAVEKQAARAKQVQFALKALDNLDKIETDILSHMSDEELKNLMMELEKITKKVETLKKRINK